MNLEGDKQIIRYLHKHYYPFSLLSKNRLKEVKNFLRIFHLRKHERIELNGNPKGDYFHLLKGKIHAVYDNTEKVTVSALDLIGKPLSIPEGSVSIAFCVQEDSTICHIENDMIDHLLSWQGIMTSIPEEQEDIHEQIDHIQNSLAFRRLPTECVIEAFKCMKTIRVKKGDEVIRQGEEGTAFYLIQSGRAEVWVLEEFEDEPEMVKELGPYDSFGEYALLADKSRNATVRMLDDGVLLTLEKQDFLKFFSGTMVREVNVNIAKAMMDGGYKLIDVRFEEEYDEVYIPEAALIPLNVFRERITELDKGEKYIVHCRSGQRSRVAALLMSTQGFDAMSMSGGINEWPFEKKGLSIRD
ncbi:MAG: cyclic nucleotide-binding domain-containing protein [Gammaproteobacteria bacterium]|nr:cyclic nucleotide-binding domain-containing protein [Gammaproteobacteria bacterium]